jgi:hypothetical protein
LAMGFNMRKADWRNSAGTLPRYPRTILLVNNLPGSHPFADSLHFRGQERSADKTPQVVKVSFMKEVCHASLSTPAPVFLSISGEVVMLISGECLALWWSC